jgi:hypothetical protein
MTRDRSADAEIAGYAREIGFILDQVCVSLHGLDPDQLAWRPATGSANSAAGIATHVVASTRVYALGFGCGREVARDRAAEFRPAGADPDALVAAVRDLAREIGSALSGLDPAALDVRIVPPRELWGTGEIHEISRRDALLESVRHAALHLGELRLTRDLVLAHARKR